MKARIVLTIIWLTGFVLVLLIAESYVHLRTADGIRYLLPQDRMDSLGPLLYLFGGHVGGILAFWFLKPFPKARDARADNVRFWIAVSCTMIFTLTVIYFVAYAYLFGADGPSIRENVEMGTGLAWKMAFMVAPINFYYFGMKMQQAQPV